MVRGLFELADGESRLIPIGDAIRLSIEPGAGATVSVSRVEEGATAHHAASSTDYTAFEAIDVNWPFYFVSTAGGAARVALV